MSEPASISSGIAARYATAIFELSKDNGSVEKLESNLADLAVIYDDSADLRALVVSPVVSRAEQGKAIAAIGASMGLVPDLQGGLGIMAENRRLFTLPHLIAQLRAMIADHKGEVTADVISATELSPAQAGKLAETLKKQVGREVRINATVDESLIGGLVVKVGSKMIDTSIRSRLDSLKNAMKEVG